jgi:hypothetical protein
MTQFAKRWLLVGCVLAVAWMSACDKSEPTHEDEHAEASAPDEHADDNEHAGDEHAHDDPVEGEQAQVGQSPTSLDELPEGVNVVQNEMRLLDEAMRTTLTLIANDQLDGIPAQIKKVHPARQLTEEAIEKGLYQTPKNPDKVDEFVALDNEFHDDLKGLLKASKSDDLQMATEKFGDLVQGCTTCHTQYRF